MPSPDEPLNPYVPPVPTDPAEIHFKKAWQLRKEKRFQEAAGEFLESLKHNPEKGATHFNLALTYDNLNDGGSALQHARTAETIFLKEANENLIANTRKLIGRLEKKYQEGGNPPA